MLIRKGTESRRVLTAAICSGDVVVMACDTIYGFVGRVPDTENKIRGIKGREETKPFLQLIAAPEDLNSLGFEPPPAGFARLWPGPFTYVLAGPGGLTTAFRVPEDEFLREMARSAGSPLYSTSVNRAGSPPMEDPKLIEAEFGDEVPVIEDAGLFTGRSPSTVVNLASRPYSILRQGAGIVPAGLLI